jgi:hypothetical protein
MQFVLSTYMQSIGENTVIDEQNIFALTDTIRFTVAPSISNSQLAVIQLSLPQHSLEQYLNIHPHVLSVSTLDVSSFVLMYQSSLSMIPYNRSQFSTVFDSLSMSLDSMSISSELELTVQFPLQRSISNISVDANLSTYIQCRKGHVQQHEVVCGSVDTYAIHCNGSSLVLKVICPIENSVPKCASATPQHPSTCNLQFVRNLSFSCACHLSPNTSRRLMLSDVSRSLLLSYNVSQSKLTTTYLAMLETVSTTFVVTASSAASLNLESLNRSWTVLATLITLVGIMLGCGLLGRSIDAKVNRLKDTVKESPPNANIDDKLSLETLAESALPRSLQSMSLMSRVQNSIRTQHRWVSVALTHVESSPRHLRILSLATNVIVTLFVQSLTYSLSQGDDGSCGRLVTEQICLSVKSSFRENGSKCGWDMSSNTCFFLQPDSSVLVILFVTVVSAMFSTPLATFCNWLCQRILAAPTKIESETRMVSVIPIQESLEVNATEIPSKVTDVLVATELLRCQTQLQSFHAERYHTMSEVDKAQWLGKCNVAV